MQVDYSEVDGFVLQTELIPLCLCNMEVLCVCVGGGGGVSSYYGVGH